MNPLILDLFCGAGGAATGYHRAGFGIIGIDLVKRPRYPFDFIEADALQYLTEAYATDTWPDAIHASPPCQTYSAMSGCRPGLSASYPDLIEPTRQLLQQTGLPWVMENVKGSGLLTQSSLFDDLHGVTLCGRMFGLKLYRHRLFESNIAIAEPAHPRHLTSGGRAGHWRDGEIISVSGHFAPASLAREAMGIDWMTSDELAEAIPPAYTHYIGEQLLAAIKDAA
jgi:DNA (cytosine-5)-methyltransferase 1